MQSIGILSHKKTLLCLGRVKLLYDIGWLQPDVVVGPPMIETEWWKVLCFALPSLKTLNRARPWIIFRTDVIRIIQYSIKVENKKIQMLFYNVETWCPKLLHAIIAWGIGFLNQWTHAMVQSRSIYHAHRACSQLIICIHIYSSFFPDIGAAMHWQYRYLH